MRFHSVNVFVRRGVVSQLQMYLGGWAAQAADVWHSQHATRVREISFLALHAVEALLGERPSPV